MQLRAIPKAILIGTVTMLREYCPDLTETRLVDALRSLELAPAKAHASDALPAFIDKNQAASLLSVSPYTVVRMCKDGRIQGTKVGAQWRIPADAIRALLNT